ncbi:MAG: hypothetical protein QXX20_00570 [Candidatus Thermoplasmatota archaeon]
MHERCGLVAAKDILAGMVRAEYGSSIRGQPLMNVKDTKNTSHTIDHKNIW